MINFTGWQYYKYDGQLIGIKKVNDDGSITSISLQDPDVAKWLANGGVPLPADEVTQ